MDLPTTTDDFRHPLTSGEHEAFYFVFSAPDQQVFGFLRTLFGHDDVLELVALRVGGRTWVYRRRTTLPGPHSLSGDASGPALTLTCREPWQTWRCRFEAEVQAIEDGSRQVTQVDLTFTALNPPAFYRLGPYQQAQQDGQLMGRVQVGAAGWDGAWLCYRDHSWGQRSVSVPASAWTVACVPDLFYIASIQAGPQTVGWGRFKTPDGQFAPVPKAQVTATETAWRMEATPGGPDAWQAQRATPPLTAYLGPAGQEDVRDAPQSDDLYRDEIGPALFTFPSGETTVGFIEYARRLP